MDVLSGNFIYIYNYYIVFSNLFIYIFLINRTESILGVPINKTNGYHVFMKESPFRK